MLAKTLRTRGVTFAYLFGPPRFVRRNEAYEVHEGVCKALSCEDLSLQYENPPAKQGPNSQAFSMKFERKQGQGAFAILIENQGIESPIRLVVQSVWPSSRPEVTESVDLTASAVFEKLQGDWQKILAEVRIRAQCEASGGDGIQFLRRKVFNLPDNWYEGLGGPLAFAAARMEVPARAHHEDPMDGPRRELTIELLKDDPRCIYLEHMSQWRQVPEIGGAGQRLDLTSIRPFDAKPSAYIEDAYGFLEGAISLIQS